MGQFSFWHLIMLFGIALLVFGPSRLEGLGSSLGKAIRGFKDGIKGEEEEEKAKEREVQALREQLAEAEKKINDKNGNKSGSNTQS